MTSFPHGAPPHYGPRGGLIVVGTGTARTPVDTATLACGVEVTSDDAGDAFRAAAASAGELRTVLLAHGIDESAARTVGVTLVPRYDYAGGSQQLLDYQATQRLSVTVADLAGLGELLSAISEIRSVRIDELTLAAANPRQAESTARTAAMMDAREKAESLAALAARPLGPVLSAEERPDHGGGPTPLFARDMAAAMPVATGDTTVSVSVRVHFGWADS